MVDCKILIPASLCLQFAHAAPIGIQAQEHGNVTLTWGIPLKADAPRASLYIDILSVKLEEHCTVYRYSNLYQYELFQDQLYRGRVRCNLELAQQGRIECVFIDLRLNDSGIYTCIAGFDGENLNRGTQNLRVKEADPPPTVNLTSEPVGRNHLMILVCSILLIATVLGLFLRFIVQQLYYLVGHLNSLCLSYKGVHELMMLLSTKRHGSPADTSILSCTIHPGAFYCDRSGKDSAPTTRSESLLLRVPLGPGEGRQPRNLTLWICTSVKTCWTTGRQRTL